MTRQRLIIFWDRDNVSVLTDNPGAYLYDNIQKVFLAAKIDTALELGYLVGLERSMAFRIPSRGVSIESYEVPPSRNAADKAIKEELKKFTRSADKDIYSILLISDDHYFIPSLERLQNLGWRVYLACIEEKTSRSLVLRANRSFCWYEMSHGCLKDIRMKS